MDDLIAIKPSSIFHCFFSQTNPSPYFSVWGIIVPNPTSGTYCVMSSPDHPQTQWLHESPGHGLRKFFILMVTVYYSKRIQVKISNRKKTHLGKTRRKHAQTSLPIESAQTHTCPQKSRVTTHAECCQAGKLSRTLVGVQSFYWRSLKQASRICTSDLSYLDSSLPEQNQELTANNTVNTDY